MAGDLTILSRPSPNFGERRGTARPDMVVIHYTAMQSGDAAMERLCDPETEVSAHYLVERGGRCWQLVDEAHRAWHAGAGSWGGRGDVNSHSIGIELDNDGASPFPDPLMRTLASLLAGILSRWSISPARVIGHSDMAPGRKIDPGPRFDWRRLALQGLACWPQAGAADEGACAPEKAAPPEAGAWDFEQALTRLGYPSDAGFDDRLAAFRARFRPQARGAFDVRDIALARGLADRFPVDPGETHA